MVRSLVILIFNRAGKTKNEGIFRPTIHKIPPFNKLPIPQNLSLPKPDFDFHPPVCYFACNAAKRPE